ncbi:MAG: hypothetical protein Q8K92_08330 [Leadbetterella sp.]|nr:hypothetical protein [Leadbetterella sp.]
MAVYRMKNGKCVKRLTVKEMDGFAPRSPELYAYLDGLYKKTRWLNV